MSLVPETASSALLAQLREQEKQRELLKRLGYFNNSAVDRYMQELERLSAAEKILRESAGITAATEATRAANSLSDTLAASARLAETKRAYDTGPATAFAQKAAELVGLKDTGLGAADSLNSVHKTVRDANRLISATQAANVAAIAARNGAVHVEAPSRALVPHYNNSTAPRHSVQTVADLGALVRKARKKMKMNQATFAALTGVGRRFLSELESGKGSMEFDKVVGVALAVGIDLFARPRDGS